MMAATIDQTWSSGTYGNKHTQSCVGVAGFGLSSAFCHAVGTLQIERRDDGSVWIANKTMTAKQSGISNALSDGSWGSDNWYFQGLFCNPVSFTMTVDSSGAHATNTAKNITGQSKVTQVGYGTGNASNHEITVTQGAWNAVKIADSIDELEHTADGKTITLYFAGGITIGKDVSDPAEVTALGISFTGEDIPKLFDYIPCAIRVGGAWKSCNRDGGTLQLKLEGSYEVCKNSLDSDDSNNSVFIKSGGKWVVAQENGEQ